VAREEVAAKAWPLTGTSASPAIENLPGFRNIVVGSNISVRGVNRTFLPSDFQNEPWIAEIG
jgi:hypothetical protein